MRAEDQLESLEQKIEDIEILVAARREALGNSTLSSNLGSMIDRSSIEIKNHCASSGEVLTIGDTVQMRLHTLSQSLVDRPKARDEIISVLMSSLQSSNTSMLREYPGRWDLQFQLDLLNYWDLLKVRRMEDPIVQDATMRIMLSHHQRITMDVGSDDIEDDSDTQQDHKVTISQLFHWTLSIDSVVFSTAIIRQPDITISHDDDDMLFELQVGGKNVYQGSQIRFIDLEDIHSITYSTDDSCVRIRYKSKASALVDIRMNDFVGVVEFVNKIRSLLRCRVKIG
ncbi:MAG: hypothetical protein Q9222_004746 [Ikaeria aurantiellina]